ncbi:bifunctional proline dehydrogenase/L-glutamate gamma-semialdehyde dehydrogenase PutA [Cupriavidus consociatus]|uniref:bifunctional proline dehydrogenase/L-glutamate gamma-semialdehyde dehydrogenase PutA n=1 Tax=Cupriavidus consociatus TaxID=2821357 RepID=UPI001FD798C9|nr:MULTISPECIES: bifunctional proline dehydrogenase/L-glutamate gamma-semialdehyde dehydrogenase PutA [unclassified Cupriavidus]MDK2655879.1 bifunctional proline dehydrogenase/L-glutamate gamma-semialdehyde dehydrogenase PutA [Cupriavidus sp. LEh21]
MLSELKQMQTATADLGVLRQRIDEASGLSEEVVVKALMREASMDGPTLARTQELASRLAQGVRDARINAGGVDLLTQEFSLDSREGIALMCLAEAMLRIPDTATRNQLIRDKIVDGDWRAHIGKSPSLFVNATAWGLLVTGKLLKQPDESALTEALTSVLRKGGEAVVRAGVAYAMRMLGKQFVTGQTIEEAIGAAKGRESNGYRYSYDMLGEAALTDEDANAYFNSYMHAIEAIGQDARGRGPIEGPGVSVKISGLHPRYELAQRDRVISELYPRLLRLAELARRYQIGFHLDQEESARFDLTLEMLERLCREPSLRGWNGIGISLQAYQKRGHAVAQWIVALARATGRRINIRLVKGAYWDTEIKLSQDAGSAGYPVFTRKVHSDVSYLACAKILLAAPDAIFPQFATHNAFSIAAVHTLAGNQEYEFQCLHGMGETVYDQVVGKSKLGRACRIYAPVGPHATLLAYLVRRLLENGANSSFVNQIVDPEVSIADIVEDPVARAMRTGGKPHAGIVMPTGVLPGRVNAGSLNFARSKDFDAAVEALRTVRVVAHSVLSGGHEVQSEATALVYSASDNSEVVGTVAACHGTTVNAALDAAALAAPAWAQSDAHTRASCIEQFAGELEKNACRLGALLVYACGATLHEAAEEVRNAVNLCRLYAYQLKAEQGAGSGQALGIVASLTQGGSPLSSFVDHVAASVAAGNVVIARPSPAGALVAYEATNLFARCGMPEGVLQLLLGAEPAARKALLADRRVAAVLYEGDNVNASLIAAQVAEAGHQPRFVARVATVNAMIVDSTALPEQVISDAMVSAFRNAGQLATSLRVLCLQDSTADTVLRMLSGMLSERETGDPFSSSADIGPVATREQRDAAESYVADMARRGFKVVRGRLGKGCDKGNFVAPTIIDLGEADALKEINPSVLGPVLHVVRWRTGELDSMIDRLNAVGCGVVGLHTRINEAAGALLSRTQAHSVCVNRAMHKPFVGMQPHGGSGAAGTGPMAAGPLALYALQRKDEKPVVAATGPFAPSATLSSDKFHEFPVHGKGGRLVVRRDFMQKEKMSARARVEALRALAAEQRGAMAEVSNQAVRLTGTVAALAPVTLPALTGEENTYEYLPRGQVLCIGDSLQTLIAQAMAATAFGNEVILLKSAAGNEVAARLRGTCQVVDAHDAVSVIGGAVSGVRPSAVLVTSGHRDLPQIRTAAIKRLVAVVLADEQGTYDWTGLVRERVTTVNASAAGGNTQLMVLSEDGL